MDNFFFLYQTVDFDPNFQKKKKKETLNTKQKFLSQAVRPGGDMQFGSMENLGTPTNISVSQPNLSGIGEANLAKKEFLEVSKTLTYSDFSCVTIDSQ